MRRLGLLGASGHGKVVADAAIEAGWEEVVFFDDAWPSRRVVGHWAIEGNSQDLIRRCAELDGVVVSIGNCATRWAMQQELAGRAANLLTIVHPRACVSRHALLGAGTVVLAGAVVNADATLGAGVIVNTGATVDHDCVIGNAVHIAPGAHLSGNVRVGEGSWIGVGAAVRQGMEIGRYVTVGAGAVVVKSAADGLTLVGNPAAPMRPRAS